MKNKCKLGSKTLKRMPKETLLANYNIYKVPIPEDVVCIHRKGNCAGFFCDDF